MEYRSVEEIIDDTEKGASELAVDAALALQHLDEKEAEEYVTKLIKNRGTMTPLVNLANEFFLALEKGKDHHRISKRFMERIQTAKEDVVEKTEKVLEKEELAHVATLSYSSTVVESLTSAEEVTVFESRPKKEGRKTAENLAQDKKIHYWVDAGMMEGSESADAVIVGADTVTSDFFVNKLGTYPLVLCAEERDLPVYVAADTTKYLPKGLAHPVGESHPSREVLESRKNNIEVHNEYFEEVPLTYEDIYLISEEGVMDKETLSNLMEEKEVSNRLKQYLQSTEEF